jgi:hypothetical protein
MGGMVMNRMLASILNFINIVYAVLIIFGCIYAGSYFGEKSIDHQFAMTILGGIIGFLLAGAICGFIALLTLIEAHLRAIRNSGGDNYENEASSRMEPTIRY